VPAKVYSLEFIDICHDLKSKHEVGVRSPLHYVQPLLSGTMVLSDLFLSLMIY
jgi:hypothetical protein